MNKFMKSALAAALALAGLGAASADAGGAERALRLAFDVNPVYRGTHLRGHYFAERDVFRPYVRVPADPVRVTPYRMEFDCMVAGTPVEFPDDIRIANPYGFTVPAGTVAVYTGPFGNSGQVILPMLKPGGGVYVAHAIPGGAEAGAWCSASAL